MMIYAAMTCVNLSQIAVRRRHCSPGLHVAAVSTEPQRYRHTSRRVPGAISRRHGSVHRRLYHQGSLVSAPEVLPAADDRFAEELSDRSVSRGITWITRTVFISA